MPIIQHRDIYPNYGSWHSLVKGMRKEIPQIDVILIEDGDIFIYLRRDDDSRMWCHHCSITDDVRRSIDEGRVGIGEDPTEAACRAWPRTLP
jgi:hypothetical protein